MEYEYADHLESERLITRKAVAEDHKEWSVFFTDKEATQFIPTFNLPTPQLRAKHWIEKQLYRYENNRYGLHVLVNRETGKIIGMCGLLLQDVNGTTELEIGYHLIRSYWGKGYATEAAGLFRDYAFARNLASSLISLINVKNFRSQQVAERNGLCLDKKISWSGEDIFIYRIHKP